MADDDGADLEDPNKLFFDDPQPRSPGKPRRTKSQKSDSTTMVGSSSSREAFKELFQKEMRQDREGFGGDEKEGNFASTSGDGNALCCEAAVANKDRTKFADVWLFDTRATFHMTARREWFYQYKPISGGGSVYSCNDHELKIIRIRSIMVKMHDGTVHTIRDVRHVEGLKKNLLPLGQLDDHGCKINGSEASVASHSPSHRVAVTWHQKLGHMSEQGMKILIERKLLPGLTKVSLPFCEHCVISKQHRLKFKTSNSRNVYVLELVHFDVWQAPVLSLGGATYFVSFIDDYSKRCWVYPIKKKSDVFEVFKVYKAQVELDSGKKIKCLRTDNEGEYTGDEFDTFCKQKGIKRQFTTAYNPQQNGVAERMNRTLLERARGMLATGSFGKLFWVEAVNTAYLHIFRSPVYVMYNTQETTKLDQKSRKCLFLGYADGVKGYRLWDPTAHKVVVNRDDVFMEDKIQENKEGDSTTSETTSIQIEKEFQSNGSFEAVPRHEVNETDESQALATRTLNRERRHPGWKAGYVMESNVAYCLLTKEGEPSTLQEELNNLNASFWKEVMQEEIKALHKNKTWELRYRARLVVKGYAEKEGIYFNEIFSPVVRMTTIRVVLAMCATYDLHPSFRCEKHILHEILKKNLHAQPEGPNKDRINRLKAQLAREFEMKSLGPANKILGMQIHRDRVSRKIWRSQKSYVKKILQRPDIAYAVGVVSLYMGKPGREHWEAVKRILRYVKGTSDVSLCFGDSDLVVTGYVDSDYVGDLDGSKSTIGCSSQQRSNMVEDVVRRARCMRCLKAYFQLALYKKHYPQTADDDGADLEDPNKLFFDDPQPRSPGKPRRTKSQKSNSTTMVGSSSSREAFKKLVQKEMRQDREKNDIIAT
ncbi:retrovirus-related pol polyprotein from transposon TNT 1-94 [Tanacetum coccineum]